MAGVQIDGVNNKIDFDDDLDTSISANTDDTLVIEAGGNTMATITATTFTINDGTTITTADNTDTLTLVSTDADANIGPNLNLYRNSSSPADNDVTGVIAFNGRNDNSQDVIYARQLSYIKDASDGTEDGQLTLQTMVAGTIRDRLNITPTEISLNEDSQDLDFRVESNGNANMIFVDGGNDHVNIGTATDLGGVLNVSGTAVIQTADNTDTLTLTSTDADANAGPNLRLYRNSANPADSDTFGQIDFEGRNDNSQDFVATQIKVNCGDVSDGNEGAQIEFDVMTGGTLREYMRMAAGSNPAVIINQDSRDINLQVLSDGNDNMLFVDGGNNRVGIGTGSPTDALHIKAGNGIIRLHEATQADTKYAEIESSNGRLFLHSDRGNAEGSSDMRFHVDNTETMRINSNGNLAIGTTSTSGGIFVEKDLGGDYTIRAYNSNNSNPTGIFNYYSAAAPDSSGGNMFLRCQDTSAVRLDIRSDGDVLNHDNAFGSISDERIKQDIRDSNSQWDDIKAVKIRNYKKKDDIRQYGDNAWEQIGVVAQELETVSPKLIRHNDPSSADILSSSEFGTLYTADDAETQDAVLYTSDDQEVIDGDKNVGDIKTPSTAQIGEVKEIKEQVKSVNYSILYMKAIKALQEAQTRIETLETKVAALEG